MFDDKQHQSMLNNSEQYQNITDILSDCILSFGEDDGLLLKFEDDEGYSITIL